MRQKAAIEFLEDDYFESALLDYCFESILLDSCFELELLNFRSMGFKIEIGIDCLRLTLSIFLGIKSYYLEEISMLYF